jgi:tRNA modification GTPase
LVRIHEAMNEVQRRLSQRGLEHEEPRVVLLGSPNVGKSSLFNALSGAPRAIVSEQAGTTRDFVSHRADIHGRRILLIDTAGNDPLEPHSHIGQAARSASNEQSGNAELQLLCLDATRRTNAWEREELARIPPVPRLVVWTKWDLGQASDYAGPAVATSSRTGEGLGPLREAIAECLDEADVGGSEVVRETAVRCRDSLQRATESVERAKDLVAQGHGEELIAAEVRLALDELGAVVGAVYTDDLLDRIFGRFCIGK